MDEITFIPTVTQTCNDVGINETENKVFNFGISPNPADQFAVCGLQFANKENTSLNIFDATGKIVFKSEISSERSRTTKSEIINVSSWQNGIYFCELQAGSKIVVSKFVVQH